jgi:hypothetical protein
VWGSMQILHHLHKGLEHPQTLVASGDLEINPLRKLRDDNTELGLRNYTPNSDVMLIFSIC